MRRVILSCIMLLLTLTAWSEVTISHALSIRGTPKYGPDFQHFDYVRPDAPQGGTLRRYNIGTYDNFHRYALRGVPDSASTALYDTLMTYSADEVESVYPLIAEKLEYPDDFTWVIFHIDPRARFQDGEPITAEDVRYSFTTFMEKGVPQFRSYFKPVREVEVLDRLRIKFTLEKGDREMVLSLASLTIIPRQWWKDHDFSEPQTEVPLGSGAYTISDYKIGQYIVYKRLDDYWARDLPVNRGRDNFDYIRYDYYRDSNVAFEAFKAGEYDLRFENTSKNWATLYTGPAFDKGYIKKETIEHQLPANMQALVFNIQRPIFSDPKVRRAIGYLFDFEWMNKNLFYGQYARTRSFFQHTEYEAKGLPSPEEKKILEPIRDQIPPELFTQAYDPPKTDGSGNIRGQMRSALALFKEAGWEVRNRKLVNAATGKAMEFELLLADASLERVALAFQKNLERVGITMNIRVVDVSQFTNRLRERDFDMISSVYRARRYPDSGLLLPWHSAYLDSTYNTAGVSDPAVDYLIEGIIRNQENGQQLIYWGRALDRVLSWNFYLVPEWHNSAYWISYWNKFSRPPLLPKYSTGVDCWWYDEQKAAMLPEEHR
ncbi:extracellular solute-binding protein [Sediminispirochaeta bajacaliforniensis]|uniref:extracellular solute-binding protein n=1 Tax=Sediminispirochaeta bajacaliforniensis TaxID=148 RepID=UPI00039C75C0|nr:extracellular solute-binding protein [Sediminispirochaeta bajacaliforniensis]